MSMKSNLSESELNHILECPESFYLFKDDITDTDLIYLFSHIPGKGSAIQKAVRAAEMLELFIRSGLSITKINANVQKSFANCVCDDNVEKVFKICTEYKISVTDDLMKKFIIYIPKDLIQPGIEIPREVLSYGIINWCRSVENISVIMKYLHKKYELSDPEQWVIIKSWLPKVWRANNAEIHPGLFMDKYFPFSRDVQYRIVNDANVLSFFINTEPSLMDHLPADLRIMAIQTNPSKELFNSMQKNPSHQITDQEQIEFIISARKHNVHSDVIATVKDYAQKTKSEVAARYIYVLNKVEQECSVSMYFEVLDDSVLLSLLKTPMNKICWYKMVENMLAGRMELSDEVIKQMIHIDPFTQRMILKYRKVSFLKQSEPQTPSVKKFRLFGRCRDDRERGDN